MVKINAHLLDGNNIVLEVNPDESIMVLKRKIKVEIGVDENEQKLVVNGIIVDDEYKTLKEYQMIDIGVIRKLMKQSVVCMQFLIYFISGGTQIFLNTEDGKRITLEVVLKEKISELKKKVFQTTAIKVEDQRLIFNRKTLSNDKTLEECGITDKCAIDIVQRNTMNVVVSSLDGQIYTVEIMNDDKISSVKKKIAIKTGLKTDSCNIVFNCETLEDNKTAFDYDMQENSTLTIVTRLRVGQKISKSVPIMKDCWNGIHIFAKTMDGRTLALTKNDKIIDMKEKIHDKIGISPDEQRLIYQGGILEDDKTMNDYEIDEKSVINVVTRLRGGMQIFAKTLDEKTVSFEVSKNDRIIDIKKKIHEKIGLSPDEQRLVYEGGILEDRKIVDYYQIGEKSVINIVARLRNGIYTFIRTMDGKTFSYEGMKYDKIIDMKKKIHEKIGLSPDEHKLILVYQGRILEDDKIVDDYQIAEKSVINVVTKLRNGMQIFAKKLDGNKVSLEVTKNDTIIDIKKKIHEKIGISPDEQILMYQGGILEDDKTVDDYEIEEKSVINVVARLRERITIIAGIGRNIVSLGVTKSDKIIDIRKKIHERTGILPDKETLSYNGERLEDDKTVDEYQIDEGSYIIMMCRLLSSVVAK